TTATNTLRTALTDPPLAGPVKGNAATMSALQAHRKVIELPEPKLHPKNGVIHGMNLRRCPRQSTPLI
ncbi:MAG: hypothetical protein ACKPKO_62655, partial [Candidatus Fonsibacter sp.]